VLLHQRLQELLPVVVEVVVGLLKVEEMVDQEVVERVNLIQVMLV
jgi:hypothetical protein